MTVATSNYQKNLEKTWKIVRFPGTGPGWILYSGKLGLDLDPPNFFHEQ